MAISVLLQSLKDEDVSHSPQGRLVVEWRFSHSHDFSWRTVEVDGSFASEQELLLVRHSHSLLVVCLHTHVISVPFQPQLDTNYMTNQIMLTQNKSLSEFFLLGALLLLKNTRNMMYFQS